MSDKPKTLEDFMNQKIASDFGTKFETWDKRKNTLNGHEKYTVKLAWKFSRDAAIESMQSELDKRDARIRELEVANSQLIHAIEVKGRYHATCETHKNTSYNGQASWCYDCGAKWSIGELCEAAAKELDITQGDKDE